ncbi:fimbria/pilus outer membrane usher protein [Pseudomonas sp. RT6P73]
MAFMTYNLNHYHVTRTGSHSSRTDLSHAMLGSGLNMGLWRLRHQGNLRYDAQGMEWRSTRLYAQRAVPSLQSELTVGEGYTSGRFFSGVSYLGLEIGSDDRMLPESIRGYAPTVRGIAQTNAQVSIRQNGNEIYQTVVSPGPFEISDLYATHYNGDLQVSVLEADGRQSRFIVPFSAVSESLRPGLSRYRYALGRTRDTGVDTAFTELTYQHGLNNAVTVNSGLRWAQDYQAWLVGGVYANWLGAFGLDTTYSQANVVGEGAMSGWMSRLSYSRMFEPTHTHLTVAGYRYFNAGYRDFGDVLQSQSAYINTGTAVTRYLPHSRLDISVNQDLAAFGSVYLSASMQNYRGGHGRDTQLQAGYSQTFSHSVSLNLSVARQTTGATQFNDTNSSFAMHSSDSIDTGFSDSLRTPGTTETVFLLSVSLPLGSPSNPLAPILNSAFSHSASYGDVYQSSLSGVSGEDQSLSYGVGVVHDVEQAQNTLSGNLQKRLPKGAVGLSGSKGPDYWQASANARGALAVHGGGVTFGPYLGETFALVHANGAAGAKVINGQGAQIDGGGFALVPSLTPYRYNTIAISPEGMDENTELEDGQRRIAPFAGAAVKIDFVTRTGAALLIKVHLADGQPVLMGADVIDEQGRVVGMMGQGSQAYVRSEQPRGHLTLRWGEGAEESCAMAYDLQGLDVKQPLLRLDAECRPQE